MKYYIRIKKLLSSKKTLIFFAFFIPILFIFLTNTLHESYPDEFDNILGGWYILQGKIIYKDFFTHHAPFAYWLSGLIEIFSGQSFVKFRILYALLLVGYFAFLYKFLAKSIGDTKTLFFPIFLFLFGIAATYFWGHMLLADSLAAVFLVGVYALIVLKVLYKQAFTLQDIIFISVLCSLTLFTALTYAYLVAFIYFFVFVTFLFPFAKKKVFSLETLKVVGILGIPYLLFFIYLLVTGTLGDFYQQAVAFNQKFYIYNYPRSDPNAPVNPIRYAIVIAQNFHNNFSSLLISVRDFNFNFPFNITLAVANTAFIVYLLVKRRFWLALFLLMSFIYANVRSNPLDSRETDYQSAVYILFSLFNMVFVPILLYRELNEEKAYNKRLIFTILFILVSIYAFFTTTFLFRKYTEKTYLKFMGLQALIYNRPDIAPFMNTLTTKDEYMWIGPFEFENLFYAHGKIPSNYMILLPEFAKSPEMQTKMMEDFEKNKPKVIYFDKQYRIRGYPPEEFGQFFLDFLNENYVTLYGEKDKEPRYVSTAPITPRIDLETKLYIRKDKKEEVIQQLLQANLIKEAE